jgi:hypothetical protein
MYQLDIEGEPGDEDYSGFHGDYSTLRMHTIFM